MASIENTPARTPTPGNPAPSDAAAMIEERLRGLTTEERAQLRLAGQHLERGELEAAERALRTILASNTDHAETLRLFAVVCQFRGRNGDAVAAIRHAV